MSKHFGEGPLMNWGGFSIKQKLPLSWISTRIASEKYCEMLEISLIDRGKILMGNNFIFQQANEAINTCHSTKD